MLVILRLVFGSEFFYSLFDNLVLFFLFASWEVVVGYKKYRYKYANNSGHNQGVIVSAKVKSPIYRENGKCKKNSDNKKHD